MVARPENIFLGEGVEGRERELQWGTRLNA